MEASWTTCIRTRPEPAARTCTATTTRALVPCCRPPRSSRSRPPTKHSSTSTAPVSGVHFGLTIARRSLCRITQAVSYQPIASWRASCVAGVPGVPVSSGTPPRTTGAAACASRAAPSRPSATPDSGTLSTATAAACAAPPPRSRHTADIGSRRAGVTRSGIRGRRRRGTSAETPRCCEAHQPAARLLSSGAKRISKTSFIYQSPCATGFGWPERLRSGRRRLPAVPVTRAGLPRRGRGRW